MTAVTTNQHVILLQENVIIAIIIAIITIAMVLEKDGCIKNVGIIAKYVYRVDCVLIEQVWNNKMFEKWYHLMAIEITLHITINSTH